MTWGRAVKGVARQFRHEYRAGRALKRASVRVRVGRLPEALARVYYVTSNAGFYRLEGDGIDRIGDLATYGMALASDSRLFLTCFSDTTSYVVTGDADALETPGRKFDFKILYESQTMSARERFHGLYLDDDTLWVAQTGNNTILRLDARTGIRLGELAPFVDPFGRPILFDNHHINSVWADGETLIFVAYYAGTGSLIGLLEDGRVLGFGYPNPGLHDIVLTAEGLYFCDTFGPEGVDVGGALLLDGRPIDPDFFAEPPGYVVRGFAGDGRELLVGHSHKALRPARFDGSGKLIVIRNQQVRFAATLPFSQVYQIVRATDSDAPSAKRRVDSGALVDRLERLFGAPIYDVAAVWL